MADGPLVVAMNQIMPIGNGIVVALDRLVRPERIHEIAAVWRERMPDVPAFFIADAQIVLRDDKTVIFEFKGESLTPETAVEFGKWWEEVNAKR